LRSPNEPEIASTVLLRLREERTDAGVKEATAEGPRYAILKERVRGGEAS
jgi:hypothetical protein